MLLKYKIGEQDADHAGLELQKKKHNDRTLNRQNFTQLVIENPQCATH